MQQTEIATKSDTYLMYEGKMHLMIGVAEVMKLYRRASRRTVQYWLKSDNPPPHVKKYGRVLFPYDLLIQWRMPEKPTPEREAGRS